MSLITRCPACGTMFRVVPDQLRISEGWVRCGHCSEVFDATAHLQQLPATTDDGPVAQQQPPVQEPAPQQPAGQEPAPQQALAHEPAPQPPGQTIAVAGFLKSVDGADGSGDGAGLVVATADEPEAPGAAPMAPEVEEPAAVDAAPTSQPSPITQDDAAPAPGPQRSGVDSQLSPDAALQDFSFVRVAQRKAYWQRPLVRGLLAAGCVLLAAVLLLQAAVHERDRLAAIEPRLRPGLEALCRPLHCRVAPLKQIDSIVIESSSFNKVRGDNYRLGLALRNKAAVPLAMPGIELTLTDGQDRPVLRRVLSAADLGAASVLGAGAEWTATLPVGLTTEGLPGRITGYRLLAFYP